MNILEFLGLKKKQLVLPDYDKLPAQLIFRQFGASPVLYYAENSDNYLKKGFEGNHVVFTIADYCGRKLTTIPPILYKVKDKSAQKDYNYLRKEGSYYNYRESLRVKAKAFDEVTSHPILDILAKPNPTMNWDEFIYGYFVYKKFVGRSVIQGVSTDTGINKGKPQELWLLPANYIQAVSGSNLNIIDYYQDSRNPEFKIPTDQVLMIRNFSSDYSVPGGHLSGMSVLKSASKLLTKSNSAMDAETESLQNRGARTLVYPQIPKEMLGGGITMPDGQTIDAMNMALNKRLKEAGNQGVVLNSLPLGIAQIGLSPVDLQILETNRFDIQMWCSLFHVDSRVIFNDHTSSTLDNMKTARLNTITDGIFPDIEALKNGLNEFLVKKWDDTLVLDFDYTILPEIQDNLRQVAKDMKEAEVFTVNEIREMWKYGNYEGENADKILISSSKQILDDLSSSLPNVTDTNVAGY